MNRALRILAVAGLLALAAYFVLMYGFYAEMFTPFQSAVPASYFLRLFGTAGFALAFAAGVLALVASLQRRRRGWAILFLILILAPYVAYLIVIPGLILGLQLLGVPIYPLFFLPDPVAGQNLLGGLLALVGLVYSCVPATPAAAASRADEHYVKP